MNFKKILFTAFILYWIVVVGVSFSSFKLRSGLANTPFGLFAPQGYRMYTPMTKTKFDISYQFYDKGKQVDNISFRSHNANLFGQASLLAKMKAFNLKSIYFNRNSELNYAYMLNHYDLNYKSGNQTFEQKLEKDLYLANLWKNATLFSSYLQHENPRLKEVDSMIITLYRWPIVLQYQPDYRKDYTYYIKDSIIHKATLNKN